MCTRLPSSWLTLKACSQSSGGGAFALPPSDPNKGAEHVQVLEYVQGKEGFTSSWRNRLDDSEWFVFRVVFLLGVASLMFDKAWDSLASWLIETDDEKEPVERVVFRNGNYYYINSETEENIWLGRFDQGLFADANWVESTSRGEWVTTTVAIVDHSVCKYTGGKHDNGCEGGCGKIVGWDSETTWKERKEYYEAAWQVNDGMYSWEGRDVSIVYPRRWICDLCHLENHESAKVCGQC